MMCRRRARRVFDRSRAQAIHRPSGGRLVLISLLLLLLFQSQTIHAIEGGRRVRGGGVSSSSSSLDVGDAVQADDTAGDTEAEAGNAEGYTPDANDANNTPAATASAVGGKVSLNEIEAAQHAQEIPSEKEHWPVFLSATVLVRVSPVRTVMDTARQAIFSTAVSVFLGKIFDAQSKYDIAVRSVNVIQQGMASEMWGGRDRRLQSSSVEVGKTVRRRRDQNDIVQIETIITSQYVPETGQEFTTDDFKRMLLHVFNTFEANLVQILQAEEAKAANYATEDGYFASIEDIVMEVHMNDGTDLSTAEGDSNGGEGGGGGMRVVGIVAFIIGSIALAALLALLFVTYREQIFDKTRSALESGKNMVSGGASETTYNLQSIGREDTYSFSSQEEILRTSSCLKKESSVASDRKKNRKLRFNGKVLPLNLDDRIAKFDLSKRLSKKSNKGGSSYRQVSSDTADMQTDIENQKLNRNECYAPPGKLGVAIDTVNGQPVVHRIKHGSPLEGVLRHMDKIVAIDGVDTSCMSAADVTFLMVKSMNRVRKISFVRGGGSEVSGTKGTGERGVDPDPDWPTGGSTSLGSRT